MSDRHELLEMTVNERLFECGLFEQFERARSEWNVDRLKAIFTEIGLEGYDIEQLH
jgi:hypothetical protein